MFFQDAFFDTSKYKTWMERENERYREHTSIIDAIGEGKDISEIVDKYATELSTFSAVQSLIQEVASKYGKVLFSVQKECNIEMARYASENNALAILSDDTDFLIFEGSWRLFSFKNMQKDKSVLKSTEFSRLKLRSTLDLNDAQLAVLSTIAGNDISRHVMKESALNKKFNPKDRFPGIAKYVKTYSSFSTDDWINKIYNDFDTEAVKSIKILRQSLNFYDTVSCESFVESFFM